MCWVVRKGLAKHEKLELGLGRWVWNVCGWWTKGWVKQWPQNTGQSNPTASGLRPLSNLLWFLFLSQASHLRQPPPHSSCFQVWLIPLVLKTSMICYMPCGPLIPSQGSRGADLQTSVISHHCWLPVQHINLLPGITSCQKTEIQVRWLKH